MQMTIMLIFTSPTWVLQFSKFCEGTTKPLKNLFKTGIFFRKKKEFLFQKLNFQKTKAFSKATDERDKRLV